MLNKLFGLIIREEVKLELYYKTSIVAE